MHRIFIESEKEVLVGKQQQNRADAGSVEQEKCSQKDFSVVSVKLILS